MFSFLSPRPRDSGDPLTSVRAATAWLRELPTQDVVMRCDVARRALEQSRQLQPDVARAQALLHTDAALRAGCHRLLRQYVESVETASNASPQLWQSGFDITQAFIGAYRSVLDAAMTPKAHGDWKPHLPLLMTRLMHHYAAEAKLRIFRHERWIPAKWQEVHHLFRCAQELRLDRVAASLDAANGSAEQMTVEREYIYVLLLQHAHSGNLSPAQVDWVAGQARACCSKLLLASQPGAAGSFVVDLEGRGGLARRSGREAGPALRYLDLTPLAKELEAASATRRDPADADRPETSPLARERADVLRSAYSAIAPAPATDQRRDPREPCLIAARVHLGLAHIHQLRRDRSGSAEDGGNVIELHAVGHPALRRPATHPDAAAGGAPAEHTSWQIRDRSVSGLRIVARGATAQALSIGALAAIRQSDLSRWRLAVVRRINRGSDAAVEFGVSLIAERFEAVNLFPRQGPGTDSRTLPSDFDTALLGRPIPALHLPPPSRPHRPLIIKTIIVPSAEYADGRKVILTTAQSIYTIALRQVVEQHAEWTWVAMKVVAKQTRTGG